MSETTAYFDSFGAFAERSERLELLFASLAKAQGELTDPTKTQRANIGNYSYKYADLAGYLAVIRPALAKYGLFLTQNPEAEPGLVRVTTSIYHTSGQMVTYKPLTVPSGSTIQQIGSAITYARRYSLQAILGLASEDDDGAAATPPTKITRSKPTAPIEDEWTTPLEEPKP